MEQMPAVMRLAGALRETCR